MPLSDNLEEDGKSSIPKIPLSEGPNCVGRDCIPVTDKRLSRKHLIITATCTGSADVVVVLFCTFFLSSWIFSRIIECLNISINHSTMTQSQISCVSSVYELYSG